MDLFKRLLLLRHIDSFVNEQYNLLKTTSDILGMLSFKSNQYKSKLELESMSSIRRTYFENYSIYLQKRVIDFQYFRRNESLKYLSDKKLFSLISIRDQIIFKKIYKNQ